MTGLALHGRRPLAFGLAAVLFAAGPAGAQTLQERMALCTGCHGEDGNSKLEKTPSLAGQPAFFILNQLILTREGVRQNEAMAPFVKDLKDEDAQALADQFAKLSPKRSDEPVDSALARRGGELAVQRRCGSCHRPDLSGQDQIPRLARQRIDYLVPTMKSYRDGPRPGADTAMSAAIVGATDADIAALAHYAASL